MGRGSFRLSYLYDKYLANSEGSSGAEVASQVNLTADIARHFYPYCAQSSARAALKVLGLGSKVETNP